MISILMIILILFVFISAFFSAAETSMMSVNRYRIRHLARAGNKAAKRVSELLTRPDRLLGVILTGNTFANILSSSVATVLAVHLFGDLGVAIATILVTIVILIIGEMTPKTLAALHAQPVAMKSSFILVGLLKFLYPVVWAINGLSNGLLRLFGVNFKESHGDRLSAEELRSVVLESSGRISEQHQEMLLRILEIEKVTVDDIMIPRSDIIGIDINHDWSDILNQLSQTTHGKLPVYEDDIDNVIGLLHIRDILPLLGQQALTVEKLKSALREIYFIPESTALPVQLLNFKRENRRSALVVDEYGDIQGLITLEDILEEIVGEFNTVVPSVCEDVLPQTDGSFIIDGSVNLRELNRLMGWHLPVDGPKTLSGLITEYLESMPLEQICLRLYGYPLIILSLEGKLVKSVRCLPQLYQAPSPVINTTDD